MSIDSSMCDAVIVGGGPAGATAALTLARQGLHALLVEGSRYDEPRVGETLPPSARQLLRKLGVWDSFLELDAIPAYGNQSAWGGPDLWSNPFIFNPDGNGWHVDRRRFDQLLAGMAAAAGATTLVDAKVTGCTSSRRGGWRLTLMCSATGKRVITTRAVIDASGRSSTVSRWLGAKRHVRDHLVGLASMYSGPACDAGYTLVEACEDGWWYTARVPANRTIVTFMTDADLCKSYRSSDLESWHRNLQSTTYTKAHIEGYTQVWGPRVFSAVSHRLSMSWSADPWLACGDAAISVDPLSSSGLVRALRTGEEAGRALANWLRGNSEQARAYEQKLDSEFNSYWKDRSLYYGMETRWPNAPFWQRRHQTQDVFQLRGPDFWMSAR